jgi:hypothetical protein
MGAPKRRETNDYLIPEEMMNVSGPNVTELARGIMSLLEQSFEEGLHADIAAQVLTAIAVDLWRANYGDLQVSDALKRAIDRRVEKPTEYWGGSEQASQARSDG